MYPPDITAPRTVFIPLVSEGLAQHYPQFFQGMPLAQVHAQVLETAENIWQQGNTPGTRLHRRLGEFPNGARWDLALHVFREAEGWPKSNYDAFQMESWPQEREGEAYAAFKQRAAREIAEHEHKQRVGAGFTPIADVDSLAECFALKSVGAFPLLQVAHEVEQAFDADLTRRLLPELWPAYAAHHEAAQRESDNFMAQMRATSTSKARPVQKNKGFLGGFLERVGL